MFNGPDEQLVAGLAIGADGSIGGTYGAMAELYLKIFELCGQNAYDQARKIQYACDEIIYEMCAAKGNLYAVIKEIIRRRYGIDLGDVRRPLASLFPEDEAHAAKCVSLINDAVAKFC